MDRMEEAQARPSHGQEEYQGVVESRSLLMMIREVGLAEVDTLLRDAVVSCRTMRVEDQGAADTMVAVHLVPVVGF